MQTRVPSEKDTEKTAAEFAKTLKGHEIIALHGTLGMGKTVFTRALIRTLCDDETMEVPSPTFTLLQTYDADIGPLYHFDCYRLEDPEEIYELGWDDIAGQGIVILEWPSKLGTLLPKNRIDITLSADNTDKEDTDKNARIITIENSDTKKDLA